MRKKWIMIWMCFTVVLGTGIFLFLRTGKNQEILETVKPQVVLPVLISGGDASWKNCMNEVASEYMKDHPDVKVEIRTVYNAENSDHARGLIVEQALGNFNGIVEMRNPELYVREGKLAELPESLSGQIKQVQTIDGRVYALSRFYLCRGIIYNQDIFDQYRLEIPETYQEFLEVCRTLKKNGVCPLAVGAGDLWHLGNWCSVLFYNDIKLKYPDWIERRNRREVHWSDEEPKKMCEDFQQLFQEGLVNENFAETTDAQTIEMLTERKVAMLCSGTWMFSQILKADSEFRLGWFFLPNDETEPVVELDDTWKWTITASCRENGLYDLAVDFLEFYYSRDVYQSVLQDMNGFSSLKEELEYHTIPIQEEICSIVQEKGKLAGDTPNLNDDTPEGFLNVLRLNMLKLAQGRQSVSQTVKILDQEWERHLEKDNET